MDQPKLVTIREAAREWDVSTQWVYQMIAQGRIETFESDAGQLISSKRPVKRRMGRPVKRPKAKGEF